MFPGCPTCVYFVQCEEWKHFALIVLSHKPLITHSLHCTKKEIRISDRRCKRLHIALRPQQTPETVELFRRPSNIMCLCLAQHWTLLISGDFSFLGLLRSGYCKETLQVCKRENQRVNWFPATALYTAKQKLVCLWSEGDLVLFSSSKTALFYCR